MVCLLTSLVSSKNVGLSEKTALYYSTYRMHIVIIIKKVQLAFEEWETDIDMSIVITCIAS